MSQSTAKLLEAASRLPASEKLELVDRLIAELDIPDSAVEALWAEAAAQRSEAVKRGEMPVRPLAEVLRKYCA